mgnify:CR=1 FL=1
MDNRFEKYDVKFQEFNRNFESPIQYTQKGYGVPTSLISLSLIAFLSSSNSSSISEILRSFIFSVLNEEEFFTSCPKVSINIFTFSKFVILLLLESIVLIYI